MELMGWLVSIILDSLQSSCSAKHLEVMGFKGKDSHNIIPIN